MPESCNKLLACDLQGNVQQPGDEACSRGSLGATIAQLDCLIDASGCPTGDSCSEEALVGVNIGLDRRIAPGVEYVAPYDLGDDRGRLLLQLLGLHNIVHCDGTVI